MRELSFPILFVKVSKWIKTRAECKSNYCIYKCFFKPLNTNGLANSSPKSDIVSTKKKKKQKNMTWALLFSQSFHGRSGEGNITFFFFGKLCKFTLKGSKTTEYGKHFMTILLSYIQFIHVLYKHTCRPLGKFLLGNCPEGTKVHVCRSACNMGLDHPSTRLLLIRI